MLTLHVEGMSCAHCVRAVTEAIRALDPEATVEVDLPSSTVRTATTLPREAVASALAEEGYTVAA